MEGEGRKAFEEMYKKFKTFHETNKSRLIKEVVYTELYSEQKRIALVANTFNNANKQKKEKLTNAVYDYFYGEQNSEHYIFNEYHRDNVNEFFHLLKSLIDNFEANKNLITRENNMGIFRFLGYRGLLGNEDKNLEELELATLSNPPDFYKRKIYEEFYAMHENIIGHYYRNLYRTVKYIQEYDFSSNGEDDERLNSKEQKEYRGILRAQLSSYELLMLFYNICYSDKGENFKALLESTNFFDNHLVEDDFIWENDIEQLKFFKIP